MTDSQTSRVLKMLKKGGSRGIANYEFQNERVLCYTKRISDLRKEGYTILTERDYLPNGRTTGVFRFILIKGE